MKLAVFRDGFELNQDCSFNSCGEIGEGLQRRSFG
jgi:hypothetical protein